MMVNCDLLDYSDRQGRYSGSSGMRRALEMERLAGTNLVQVGLRGYTTVEQYEIGRQLGVRRISAARFAEMSAQAAAEQALSWAGDGTQARLDECQSETGISQAKWRFECGFTRFLNRLTLWMARGPMTDLARPLRSEIGRRFADVQIMEYDFGHTFVAVGRKG